MRRVLRWAWNGAAALSLLLCVAACVLWARSYRRWDDVLWWDETLTRSAELLSSDGAVCASWGTRDRPAVGRTPGFSAHAGAPAFSVRYGKNWYSADWAAFAHEWDFAGIQYRGGRLFPGYGGDPSNLVVPYGYLVAAFALAPGALLGVAAVGAVRRKRRRARGCCRRCGYDLRATPGRCPECGREGAV